MTTFILKGINPKEIIKKYNLFNEPLESLICEPKQKKTLISEVLERDPEISFSFYDEKRKPEKYIIHMYNLLSLNKLPSTTNIHCFWDRHEFTTCPLGCPIKFVNSIIEKTYQSISKEEYNIRENITNEKIDTLNKDLLTIYDKNYYLVDGIFCSFNCILAFINENKRDPLYKESLSLLSSLYVDLTGDTMKILKPANDWRLLKQYGGNMSIEEFREFKENTYAFNITNTSCIKPMSKVFKILN